MDDLVRQSLLDGREPAAMLDGAALGIQVLADQGHETYVAIRIIGSVSRRLVATILSLIPGCELDAWMSDYAMPERAVAPRNRSGPTSWTPPPQPSSSISSHEPPLAAVTAADSTATGPWAQGRSPYILIASATNPAASALGAHSDVAYLTPADGRSKPWTGPWARSLAKTHE